jgi:hypothetical protein
MAYRSTNKTVYSAKYHLIWCPKYRVTPGWSRLRRYEMDRSDQPADAALVPVAAPLPARREILRVAPRLNIRGHHAADSVVGQFE